MRKRGYDTLIARIGLLLLVAAFFISLRPHRALVSEKVFISRLHNSLYYLDQAKEKWAQEKHKSEGDVPSMADLTPYLGDWTNHIEQFTALGITYKITPISEEEPQSDIATLTRDLCFRSGICRFYPADTRYCIHTGWTNPDSARSLRALYINNQGLIAAALFIAGITTLLVFVVRRIRTSRRGNCVAHERQNA